MRIRIEGTPDVRGFNQWLAVRITSAVSTMACAYVFLALAILGFPGWQASATQYVQWISQTVIQLVMLSVIMVGQKIMSDQQAAHHETVKAMHSEHASEIAKLHKKMDDMKPKTRARKKASDDANA